MRPSPAQLLDALLEQGEERPALALLTTRGLATLPAVAAEMCAGRGFCVVDLALVRSPFDVNPDLPRRRLITGLSWLRPELRRERAAAMNRARDRIGALGLQVVIWILAEDYIWLGEEAPDLISRVQEVLDWPEPAIQPAGRGELLCPLGRPALPGGPPEHMGWLAQTLAAPGGRAAAVGALGPPLARRAIDQMLSEERGPAAWLAMDLLDPDRVARWLGERGDLRVAVSADGLPGLGWPPELAVVIAGLPEEGIPPGFPTPPAPPTPLLPDLLPLAGRGVEVELPTLGLFPPEGESNLPAEILSDLPQARSWTVVSPEPDWELAALRAMAEARPAEKTGTWQLILEDGQRGDAGALRAWARLEGPRVPTEPSAWRSPWNAPGPLVQTGLDERATSDEAVLLTSRAEALLASVATEIAGWANAARAARELRVEVHGEGPAAEALRQIPWELLEDAPEAGSLAVVRALPGVVPRVRSEGRPRVLLAVARAQRRTAPPMDPWAVWKLLTGTARRHGLDMELAFAPSGTFADLKARVTAAAASGRPFDLVYLDVPGAFDQDGRLARLVFEDHVGGTVLDGAPHLVDGPSLAWVLREGKVRLLVLSAWTSEETAPLDAADLWSSLQEAGLLGMAGPAGPMSHADLLAAQLGFADALLRGKEFAAAGRAARDGARAFASQISAGGQAGSGVGRARWPPPREKLARRFRPPGMRPRRRYTRNQRGYRRPHPAALSPAAWRSCGCSAPWRSAKWRGCSGWRGRDAARWPPPRCASGLSWAKDGGCLGCPRPWRTRAQPWTWRWRRIQPSWSSTTWRCSATSRTRSPSWAGLPGLPETGVRSCWSGEPRCSWPGSRRTYSWWAGCPPTMADGC